MVFPIGDDQVKGGNKPMFAYIFIAFNVLVFIFQITLAPIQLEHFIMEYGSIPAEISKGQDLFTLFTSMFLHGGWMHLLGNMIFLWVFADNIEAVIGNVNFILFYIIGGLAAAFAHVLSSPGSGVPAVGGKWRNLCSFRYLSSDVSCIQNQSVSSIFLQILLYACYPIPRILDYTTIDQWLLFTWICGFAGSDERCSLVGTYWRLCFWSNCWISRP